MARGVRPGSEGRTPGECLLAADAGALPALCGEDAGVAGVGASSAQDIAVQSLGLRWMNAMVRIRQGELPQRTSGQATPILGIPHLNPGVTRQAVGLGI